MPNLFWIDIPSISFEAQLSAWSNQYSLFPQGRLVKLSVCQDLATDLDLDSQDSGIKDSNDHIKKSQYQGYYINNNELEKENNCSIIKRNYESNSSLLDSRQITNG